MINFFARRAFVRRVRKHLNELWCAFDNHTLQEVFRSYGLDNVIQQHFDKGASLRGRGNHSQRSDGRALYQFTERQRAGRPLRKSDCTPVWRGAFNHGHCKWQDR